MPDRFTVAAFANHTRPKAEGFAGYSGASMNDYHQDYRELLRRDDVETVLISCQSRSTMASRARRGGG
jgi:hypothetical protein